MIYGNVLQSTVNLGFSERDKLIMWKLRTGSKSVLEVKSFPQTQRLTHVAHNQKKTEARILSLFQRQGGLIFPNKSPENNGKRHVLDGLWCTSNIQEYLLEDCCGKLSLSSRVAICGRRGIFLFFFPLWVSKWWCFKMLTWFCMELGWWYNNWPSKIGIPKLFPPSFFQFWSR